MAITSIGYPGMVGATNIEWAREQFGLGRGYFVRNGMYVSPKSDGTRQVNIAGGFAGAHGVVDSNTSTATLALPTVATGTQYFLVGIERNWNTEASTFKYVAGGTSSAVLPPITQDGDSAGGSGIDFQPLALVPLSADDTVPGTPIDLRLMSNLGEVLLAQDERVLQYIDGYGKQVKIGDDLWTFEAWPNGWRKDKEIIVSGPGYGNELSIGGTSGWTTVSKANTYARRSRQSGWHQVRFEASRSGSSLPFSDHGGFTDTTIMNTGNVEFQPPYRLITAGEYRSGGASFGCTAVFNPDGSVGIISGVGNTEISKRTDGGWSFRVNFEWMAA